MLTLGSALALNARRHPDKPGLVFDDLSYSYSELDSAVNRYAHALNSLGVGKEDRVGLLSTNNDGLVLVAYAAFKIGAIFVPMNPSSTARELHYLVTNSGAKALVFGSGQLGAVSGLAAAGENGLASAPLALGQVEGYRSLHELASTMPDTAPAVEVEPEDDAVIIYTSGTTGSPKGALFDHRRVMRVGDYMTALGLESEDTILHAAPMYHCAELILMLVTGVTLGASHVVHPGFDPQVTLDALEEHRVTAFLGVPTMYQMITRLPGAGDRDLAAWRIGYFGAAPMSGPEVERLFTTFPTVKFMQLYGQTEGGPTGMYSSPTDLRMRPEATGRWPVPYTEVRVVDPDAVEVPDGTVGEIIIRGASVMKGYWNQLEATDSPIIDGWLHTGDLAVRDADGFVTIVDRLKDMIITGGRNVYSVEVEHALSSHQDVTDVAVIGRPHPVYGESIVAVVNPVPGTDPSLESLRAHAGDLISHYKLPHELVLSEVPRNASGKLLKQKLRTQLSPSPSPSNS